MPTLPPAVPHASRLSHAIAKSYVGATSSRVGVRAQGPSFARTWVWVSAGVEVSDPD